MMCPPCRLAGFYNGLANGQPQDVPATDDLYRMARDAHADCRDINCPCQHVTGVVINTREVEPD